MNTIQNPIVPGDWSDPAVIRVSDDFYSLRSTFGWQPGLQIIHSKDLTHWEYIGYAYPSHASLTPGDTNGGCWGSELGYDPASKSFLAYATITSAGIQAFRSDLPGGPYDGPYPLEVPGIDPGFFADDDGRLYLVASRGEIWELTAGGLSVKRLVCNVGAGQDVGFEGPQIVKRDGWYYCIYSAGGTLPHEFSSINCARSRSLEGPWEVDPGNPLMQANDDSDAVLQGPAHGMLVDTAGGEWFLTYHAFELSHYSLGRQMCMEPVEWTADGWWKPANGPIPSLEIAAPKLEAVPHSLAESDDFAGSSLAQQWFFHTPPDPADKSWWLESETLHIETRPGDISSAESRCNVFLQRVHRKSFSFGAQVEFDPSDGQETAGLHMYHDPGMSFWLVMTTRNNQPVFEIGKYCDGQRSSLWAIPNTIGTNAFLRIAVADPETATFSLSPDGVRWSKIGGEVHFGDSGPDAPNGIPGDPDLGWVGSNRRNVWTGTTFGVFAVQDGATSAKVAEFKQFQVNVQM